MNYKRSIQIQRKRSRKIHLKWYWFTSLKSYSLVNRLSISPRTLVITNLFKFKLFIFLINQILIILKFVTWFSADSNFFSQNSTSTNVRSASWQHFSKLSSPMLCCCRTSDRRCICWVAANLLCSSNLWANQIWVADSTSYSIDRKRNSNPHWIRIWLTSKK